MAKELVTDQLWEIIEPLLPPEELKPKGGSPRVPNGAVKSYANIGTRSGGVQRFTSPLDELPLWC